METISIEHFYYQLQHRRKGVIFNEIIISIQHSVNIYIQRYNYFDSTNYLYIQQNNYFHSKNYLYIDERIVFIQRFIYTFNRRTIFIQQIVYYPTN